MNTVFFGGVPVRTIHLAGTEGTDMFRGGSAINPGGPMIRANGLTGHRVAAVEPKPVPPLTRSAFVVKSFDPIPGHMPSLSGANHLAVPARPGAAHTTTAAQLSLVGRPAVPPISFSGSGENIAGASSHRIQTTAPVAVPTHAAAPAAATTENTKSKAVGIALSLSIGLAVLMVL